MTHRIHTRAPAISHVSRFHYRLSFSSGGGKKKKKKVINQSFCLLLHSFNHLPASSFRPAFQLLSCYSFMLNSTSRSQIPPDFSTLSKLPSCQSRLICPLVPKSCFFSLSPPPRISSSCALSTIFLRCLASSSFSSITCCLH